MASFATLCSSVTVVIASRFLTNDQYRIASLIGLFNSFGINHIVISTPPSHSPLIIDLYNIDGLIIVTSPIPGQSFQRCLALQHCFSDFIIQIDDDIILDNKNLAEFLHLSLPFVNSNHNRVVGPLLLPSCDSINLYSSRNTFYSRIKRFIMYLLFGIPFVFRHSEGKIFFPGAAISFTQSSASDRIIDGNNFLSTSWLPGGFVLYHKSMTLFFAPYPFPGKAYTEDCLSSFHWLSQGASLLVCQSVSFKTEFPKLSLYLSIRNYINAIPAMFFYSFSSNTFSLRSAVLYPLGILLYILSVLCDNFYISRRSKVHK